MRLRRPTRVQKVMIALMAVAFVALGLWAVPEIAGVVSPAAEDTYSEWVWDLPLWGVLGVAAAHGLAGVLFVWSAGHFIEGYRSRKGRPLDDVTIHGSKQPPRPPPSPDAADRPPSPDGKA